MSNDRRPSTIPPANSNVAFFDDPWSQAILRVVERQRRAELRGPR